MRCVEQPFAGFTGIGATRTLPEMDRFKGWISVLRSNPFPTSLLRFQRIGFCFPVDNCLVYGRAWLWRTEVFLAIEVCLSLPVWVSAGSSFAFIAPFVG